MAKYLRWRGMSLYCCYPVQGWPHWYRLHIKASKGTKSEKETLGRVVADPLLSRIKLATVDPVEKKALERLFFDTQEKAEAPKRAEYRPKYWRLVARYWYYSLRHKKCALNDRPHLKHSLKRFGNRYASEIYPEQIRSWIEEMKAGSEVNAINNRLAKMRAVYNTANNEENPLYVFDYNPLKKIKRVEGGKIRQVLLTPEMFERNYTWLIEDGRQRYAFFYLMCWETGRRPEEVGQYTWEMKTEVIIKGKKVRAFLVPAEITKTKKAGPVIISARLWQEMNKWGWRTGYVARNHYGRPWRFWQEHMKALQIKFHDGAHWLRDTRRGFATRKTEFEGHDEASVQACMGQKTNSSFRRYRVGQIESMMKVMEEPKCTIQVQKENEG